MEHPLRRPELLVCAWRGHELVGARLAEIGPQHDQLARPMVDGRRLVRCVRCDCWVLVDPPSSHDTVDDVADAPRPRRGEELRAAIVLRLIAIDRGVHAVLFAAVALAAVVIDRNISGIHGWANGTLTALHSAQHGAGGVSSHGLIAALLQRLASVRPRSLRDLALVATAYAVVEGVEAVGLWRERRWAEYLTALATAGFLPLEIHELVARFTIVRVAALVVNLAVLVYLVVAKHLFGIGGPPPRPARAELPAVPPPAQS